jgi:hypothetical protein
VKNDPTTQCAREYWYKLSEVMPFVLSACIGNHEASLFVSDYLLKVYHDMDEFITDEFGRCKNCKSIYYDFKLCKEKDHKENCELEQKPDFDDRLAIIDLPVPPAKRPRTLEQIEEWRYYLELLEDLLKEESE